MKNNSLRVGAAVLSFLLAAGPVAFANAVETSVDVSNSRASVRATQYKSSAEDAVAVNENRDAGDAPVVQPVASMKGQTCIAAGGVEVPCETDDSWFYAPESCYASTPSMAPYAPRKNYTTFECKSVGKGVPSLGSSN